jgi:hypothetical protein
MEDYAIYAPINRSYSRREFRTLPEILGRIGYAVLVLLYIGITGVGMVTIIRFIARRLGLQAY